MVLIEIISTAPPNYAKHIIIRQPCAVFLYLLVVVASYKFNIKHDLLQDFSHTIWHIQLLAFKMHKNEYIAE